MNEISGDDGPRTPAAKTDWEYLPSPPITPILNRRKRNSPFDRYQHPPGRCLSPFPHLVPLYIFGTADLTHFQGLPRPNPLESTSPAPNSPCPNALLNPPRAAEVTFLSDVNSLLLPLLLRNVEVGNPSSTISRIPPPRRQLSRRLSQGLF